MPDKYTRPPTVVALGDLEMWKEKPRDLRAEHSCTRGIETMRNLSVSFEFKRLIYVVCPSACLCVFEFACT